MGLQIGPLNIDPPVVLAPMAGVTNVAFRRLCRTYGAGLYVSEMISARGLVEGGARSQRMSYFGADEPCRSIQLYGVDPAVVGEAVRRLVDSAGADHIDLNFGCPAPKITRKGGGSALPLHHVLFARLVGSAVRAAGSVPVTIKMRVGVDDTHHTFVAAGRTAENEGAAAVALHARTAEQLYSGRADWAAIAELKAAVTTIPVLGNGDIWEAADALRMMAETGCDGVVVGRGCLGRPWLFGNLADAFAGLPIGTPPCLGQVVAVLVRHAHLLCESVGEETACRDLRKHVGWYLTGYPVGGERRRQLAQITSLADLDLALDGLDPDITLPLGAETMPRGHTSGPRRVHLPERWLTTLDDPSPPLGADAFAVVSGG